MTLLPKTAPEKFYAERLALYPSLEDALAMARPEDVASGCAGALADALLTKVWNEPDRNEIKRKIRDDRMGCCLDENELLCWANWMRCKHVFRFDKTLSEELSAMAAPTTMPVAALKHLPYPVLFIEAPVLSCVIHYDEANEDDGHDAWGGEFVRVRAEDVRVWAEMEPTKGFFVWRQSGSRIADILAIAYVSQDLRSFCSLEIDLSAETLGKGLKRLIGDIQRQNYDHGEQFFEAQIVETLTKTTAQALNHLLYLIADNAEVETIHKPSGKSRKPKVSQAEIHEVGRRMGADLRAARVRYETGGCTSGTGKQKAPHIRRGHYHHYWTGPRGGERTLIVHWLSPIAVNARGEKTSAEEAAAIHRVTA